MNIILLDNFDDGSLECTTFCIADSEGSLVCEYSYIQDKYAEYIPKIVEARQAGKHYIGLLKPAKQQIVGDTQEYFEIQWD